MQDRDVSTGSSTDHSKARGWCISVTTEFCRAAELTGTQHLFKVLPRLHVQQLLLQQCQDGPLLLTVKRAIAETGRQRLVR
jgi:hypothetical protein